MQQFLNIFVVEGRDWLLSDILSGSELPVILLGDVQLAHLTMIPEPHVASS